MEQTSIPDDANGDIMDRSTPESPNAGNLSSVQVDSDIKEIDCQYVDKQDVECDLPKSESRSPIKESLKEKKPKTSAGSHHKGSDLKTKREHKPEANARKADTRKSASLSVKSRVPISLSHSKSSSKSSNGTLGHSNVTEEVSGVNMEEGSSSDSATLGSSALSVSHNNITVPQPFALATDRRASGGRPSGGESPSQSRQSHRAVVNIATRDPQVSKKVGPKPIKPVLEDSSKPTKEVHIDGDAAVEAKVVDEDKQSRQPMSSRGIKTTKSGLVSNASGFSFKCDERAEKRKQFYTKLEEIQIAKQEEKKQIQEKTKEEMEAEIKELRKSLTFRANPMPTFYREGTPPKTELKKIPTTRAKSPKLGRRHSSGGSYSESNHLNSSTENANKTLQSNDEHPKKLGRLSLSKNNKLQNDKQLESHERENATSAGIEVHDEGENGTSDKVLFGPTDDADDGGIDQTLEDTNDDMVCLDHSSTDHGSPSAEKIIATSVVANRDYPGNGKSNQEMTNEENKALKKERNKLTPVLKIKKGNLINPTDKNTVKSDHNMPQVSTDVAVHS